MTSPELTTEPTPRNGSVYPPPVAELVPKAVALAEQIGGVPSRNQLMQALKVGAPKATAVREALITDPGLVSPTVDAAQTPDETTLPQVDRVGHPDVPVAGSRPNPVRSWPVFLIALPAAVAIWSGWVGLGSMTGFGVVHPLPGIADDFGLNTAITLPIGVEAYAAYALRAWLAGSRVPARARRFAKWSAIGSLLVGSAGQVAYHLMESAGLTVAPWQITTAVSCLPVAVLGMGAALAHLLNSSDED